MVMESVNVVVNYQGSKSTPTMSHDSDVEFLILNWYNKNKLPYNNETGQNVSVTANDASPSSNTNLVTKGDPPSSDSSHQQGDLKTDLTIDILVREPSKQVQKNHSASNIIGDPKASVQTQGNSKINYKEMIDYICYT